MSTPPIRLAFPAGRTEASAQFTYLLESRKGELMKSPRTNAMQGVRLAACAFVSLLVLVAGMARPAAASVTLITPNTFASLDGGPQDADGLVNGIFTVSGDLILDNGSNITCNDPATPATGACDINIVVTGNLVMKAGSAILAENNTDGGNGGNITITVAGDATLCGPSGATAGCGGATVNPGAIISSSQTASGPVSHAGNITITVGNFPATPPVGVFTMEPGSQVIANSDSHSAGAIAITAGKQMDVDGLVQSMGGQTGGGAQRPPGGGPITLKSGCVLTVSDEGVVSSDGKDPGADLVHLEGCEVVINGLVQSISHNAGHGAPNHPPNHCNADAVAHPLGGAHDFTACVEIWANNITINSILPHKGEVSADGVRAPNRAWIDLFAANNITINNDIIGPYSVHASTVPPNTTNRFGGLVTLKAEGGKVALSGFAIQANATGGSSDGGDVIVQAGGPGSPAGDVDLGSSSIQAEGPAGSGTHGGTISARSFNGRVLGSGDLNAPGGGVIGSVDLQGCGTAAPNDGVVYSGTSTPPATILADACGGLPTLPANVLAAFQTDEPIWLACTGGARKSGRKFNEVTKAGLDGFTIHLFDKATGGATVHMHTTTAGGGFYSFDVAPGTYTVCEEQQPTFTQTFPNPGTQDPANACSTHPVLNAVNTMGAEGYTVTLAAGDNDTGNDFGNLSQQTFQCPEDPKAILTRSVDANGGNHGVPNHTTLQAGYDAAANNAAEVIGVFSNLNENVVLGGAKTLKITQCTLGKITAAADSTPVVDITSTGKLTIVSLDTVGGTIGWRVAGNGGHSLKSVRASLASQYGILVVSNNNGVSWNSLIGNGFGIANGAGIRVTGGSNDLRGGTISSNTGDGAQLAGNGNSFQGATVQNNSANGIAASGGTNLIKGNRINSNTADGVNISGAGNKLSGNQSNTGSDNSATDNGGFEYNLISAAVNLGSNKADTLTVPSAGKCPTFPAAGTQCE